MTSPDARLSPAAWQAAALEVMAERGTAGLAIEALARRLGVTKGSFYWHFADKEALVTAALAYWEHGYTQRVIAALSEIADPRERLRRLISQVSTGGQSDRIHLALASDSHPRVRATLARVTKRRLAFLQACYAELGQPTAAARRSALLAYAAYVGLVHLRLEAPQVLPSYAAFYAYLDHVVETLVPPDRPRSPRAAKTRRRPRAT